MGTKKRVCIKMKVGGKTYEVDIKRKVFDGKYAASAGKEEKQSLGGIKKKGSGTGRKNCGRKGRKKCGTKGGDRKDGDAKDDSCMHLNLLD